MQYCQQGDFFNVLEIGTHTGYSALNLALACDHVTTIEKGPIFLKEAKDNLKDFKDKITLCEGDATKIMQNFQKNNKKFNAIFIDGMHKEYSIYLKLAISLLDDNGAIFFDNTISHKHKLLDFFQELEKSKLSYKELNTKEGLIIAFKTRKFFQHKLKEKN